MNRRRFWNTPYFSMAMIAIIIVVTLVCGGLFAVKAYSLETYWTLPAGACQGHECTVPMEDDLLSMDAFRNSLVLYSDAEKTIIVACMEPRTIEAFLAETDGAPLTAETAEDLHIGSYYLGKSFDDIFTRFPELSGTKTIVTEDGSIERPIVTEKHFLGCE